MTSHTSVRWSAGLAAIALLAASSLPIPALAQTYQPSSSIGLPGRREGGGTRGGCTPRETSLTALIPTSNVGETTRAYPTLYWYIPNTGAQLAEFALLDEADQVIYASQFAIAGGDNVMSLTIPANANIPPLEVGQQYRWEFSLICDPETYSSVLFVEGWVTRVAPSAVLTQQLATATPLEQASLYASAGIWLDALDTLGDLRVANPEQTAALNGWATLLSSVELDAIVSAPLE